MKELMYERIVIVDSITNGMATHAQPQIVQGDDTIEIRNIRRNTVIETKSANTNKPEHIKNNTGVMLNTTQNQSVERKNALNSVRNDSNEVAITHNKKQDAVNKFIFNRYDNNNFQYKSDQVIIIKDVPKTNQPKYNLLFESHFYQKSQLNWTLIIGLFSIVLLLGLKTYYQKFIALIFNSIINIQLAEKMLREKNILMRRAFFMLNINYTLIFSLFVLLLTITWYDSTLENKIDIYLLICGGVAAILVLRMIVFYLFGILFEKTLLSNEYIHNINLVNKILGIILLPLVFSAIYITAFISKIVLIAGLVIVCVATLFKILRGFQIIVKNEVLLFYSILYLCTLELLPLIICSKIIFLLR